MPVRLEPFWRTTDGDTIRFYLGHILDVLRHLPMRSVQTVVTSPPYWGLRLYLEEGHDSKAHEIGSEPSPDCNTKGQAQCGQCYVCAMVAVFREVKRVLRTDGTLWLNLGDSYGASGFGGTNPETSSIGSGKGQISNQGSYSGIVVNTGLPDGNMVGIPWRVALALQADGWVLRQDNIWAKPSPMPESVRDRCTKAHEYVFLLTQRADYFCDMDAIKEDAIPARRVISGKSGSYGQAIASGRKPSGNGVLGAVIQTGDTSNKRSVWSVDDETALFSWLQENDPDLLERFLEESKNKLDVWRVSSQGYPGAHFATFPPNLIKPCILAGTSEYGACIQCGAPWRRVVENAHLRRPRPNEYIKRTGEAGTGNSCSNSVAGVENKTVGWKPTCLCGLKGSREGVTRPCRVLDPFIGSGTTAEVCVEEGRWCWGVDLSKAYLLLNAIPRLEGVLSRRGNTRRLLPALGSGGHKSDKVLKPSDQADLPRGRSIGRRPNPKDSV